MSLSSTVRLVGVICCASTVHDADLQCKCLDSMDDL